MVIGSMIALCQGIKIIFWNRDSKISDVSLRIHKNKIGFLNSKDKKYKTIDGGVTVESLNQKGTNKRFRRRYPFIYKLIYVFTKEKWRFCDIVYNNYCKSNWFEVTRIIYNKWLLKNIIGIK